MDCNKGQIEEKFNRGRRSHVRNKKIQTSRGTHELHESFSRPVLSGNNSP